MVYRIVQYIQPWEIDDLDRQVDQHIKSSYYIGNEHNVIFDITMDICAVDWDKSELPLSYFVHKFKYLETKLKQYFTVEFDSDQSIKGCTDKRRHIQAKSQDFVIWLDSDLYFSNLTLPSLIQASKQIEEDYFIISPEIIKYWDHSWDCITHSKFRNESTGYRDYFDLYTIDRLVNPNEIAIRKNNTIKFGGGWFNLIKNSVFEKIPLIDALGSYAPDDTYLSWCGSKILSQYVLQGVVVSEVGKRLLENKNYIKPLLEVITQDKQKITDQQLYKLVAEFHQNKTHDILHNTKL